jgi:hypothetical protein
MKGYSQAIKKLQFRGITGWTTLAMQACPSSEPFSRKVKKRLIKGEDILRNLLVIIASMVYFRRNDEA